jgi:hypothetical protein
MVPCHSYSPVQPGTGRAPEPLGRIGGEATYWYPMFPFASAYPTFSVGVFRWRKAPRNSSKVEALLSSMNPSSRPVGSIPTHFMAALSGARGMTSEMIGPCLEILTGYFSSRIPSAVLIFSVSSTISKSLYPLSVRYWSGLSGLIFSMK